MNDLIVHHPSLSGVWEVATDPINKYELLQLFRDKFGIQADIRPDPSVFCDRRLDDSAFRTKTKWSAPPWDAIVEDMANNP